MKKVFSFLIVSLICGAAFAASSDRRNMASQYAPSPRAVASQAQISMNAALIVDKSSIRAETPSAAVPSDRHDKEKKACIDNNVGVGNTFVWASKYSNVGNYASMVEDVENPENNMCFVRMELKSADSKADVSDIPAVYYEMDRIITCGSWADAKKIEGRILDAKKNARTWGTVAGVVGGAAVGVGAMELFGNKLIGGAVEGQKGLGRNEKLRSQLLVLRDKDISQFNQFKSNLEKLKAECENDVWKDGATKPDECEQINYDMLLAI